MSNLYAGTNLPAASQHVAQGLGELTHRWKLAFDMAVVKGSKSQLQQDRANIKEGKRNLPFSSSSSFASEEEDDDPPPAAHLPEHCPFLNGHPDHHPTRQQPTR
ncbi:hypothetical protein Pcinc_007715 [Petrolisthes cinctipes]|uniref:Uncharacterized protein n=1 Tax=Petrolisthes cinctipes TaxID=88211 RepID=A0AAE1GAH1_PETCI|nr:hypothetical protein Pcinc_007715 [Petrolisthes cinctipes]